MIGSILNTADKKTALATLRPLAQYCSNFLEHGVPLFRGTKREFAPGTEWTLRTDRKPLHTDVTASNLYNLMMEILHGIPNIRSKCLYTSTSYKAAEYYGSNVYFVLPPNNSTYIYADKVTDTKTLIEMCCSDFENEMEEVSSAAWKSMEVFLMNGSSLAALKRNKKLFAYVEHVIHGLSERSSSHEAWGIFKDTKLISIPPDTNESLEVAIMGNSVKMISVEDLLALTNTITGQPTKIPTVAFHRFRELL